MRKLMVLAAMLAMVMVVAAPAFAQTQTSGAASSGGATVTGGDLANQCVQVANNVNSGNVAQSADIDVTQTNTGIDASTAAVATGGAGGAGGEGGTVVIEDGLLIDIGALLDREVTLTLGELADLLVIDINALAVILDIDVDAKADVTLTVAELLDLGLEIGVILDLLGLDIFDLLVGDIDASGGAGGDGGDATATNTGDVNVENVTQTQTNTSNNTITQTGIVQENNAQLTCNQAIAQEK